MRVPLGDPLQINRGAHIREVGESLRRVAQLLAAQRNLLGEHADMIAEIGHGFEHAGRDLQVFWRRTSRRG